MIFSFVTWSNFLHRNKALSNHSFYDKLTLVAIYIIKTRQKSNNLKIAVVKMKMAIFFTFRWRSICVRTLTISNLTNHHHPLSSSSISLSSSLHSPCWFSHLSLSSSSEQLQRSVYSSPGLQHWQRFIEHHSFAHLHFTSCIIASGTGERVVMTGIHSLFSIVQPYLRGDGKAGLGTQSLFQTINW